MTESTLFQHSINLITGTSPIVYVHGGQGEREREGGRETKGRGVVKYQSTSEVLANSSCKYRTLPKISPLPSLTLKVLAQVCLPRLQAPLPPSRLHTYTRASARTYVRNPALQLTTSTKRNLLYGGGFYKSLF